MLYVEAPVVIDDAFFGIPALSGPSTNKSLKSTYRNNPFRRTFRIA